MPQCLLNIQLSAVKSGLQTKQEITLNIFRFRLTEQKYRAWKITTLLDILPRVQASAHYSHQQAVVA